MPNNNPIYKFYNQIMKYVGFDYQIRRFILKHTDKSKKVESILEIGCGSAATGLALSEIFTDAVVLFTDRDIHLLEALEKKVKGNPNIELGISDISNPKNVKFLSGKRIYLNSESFDIICAGANLGYSTNLKVTLDELYDLLKPGGQIIDLEMNDGLWGRLISYLYNYPIVSMERIKYILDRKDVTGTTEKISWRFFPLNITRISFKINKLYSKKG
ncbi:MAG: hypothetical protein COA86_18450 [Kangiella sp.]|nr:MAG: hypothetical protein COA86_18450 [Kangiella sp.]